MRDPVLGGIAKIFESNLRSDAATLIGSDGDIVDGLQLLGEAAAVADMLPPSAQARIAAEQAQAFAVLELARECREAITALNQAIDATAADNRNVVLAAQVDLASAHVLIGELEEGCRMLGDAHENLVAMGNSRGLERAQCALGLLESWKSERVVRELRERIEVFTAH
jgi:hypothetical protein